LLAVFAGEEEKIAETIIDIESDIQ